MFVISLTSAISSLQIELSIIFANFLFDPINYSYSNLKVLNTDIAPLLSTLDLEEFDITRRFIKN